MPNTRYIPISKRKNTETKLILDAKNSPVGNFERAYEIALRQREFEITQLTNRNNFFMVFQGVLLSGLIQSQGLASSFMSFALCLTGLIISIFQARMAAGAKYWQIRWEAAVKNLEVHLLDILKRERFVLQLFTQEKSRLNNEEVKNFQEINKLPERKDDPIIMEEGYIQRLVDADLQDMPECSIIKSMIKNKPSVSKIPIYVGLILAVCWLILLLHTVSLNGMTIFGWLAAHVLPNGLSLVSLNIKN